MIKPLLVGMTLASLLIGAAAHSQEVPPPSDQADAVQALVTRAVALIEKDGIDGGLHGVPKEGERMAARRYLPVRLRSQGECSIECCLSKTRRH
jgi:hypothetical protein